MNHKITDVPNKSAQAGQQGQPNEPGKGHQTASTAASIKNMVLPFCLHCQKEATFIV